MTLSEQITRFIKDTDLAHTIIHGDANTVVSTEGGPVRSFAKVIADADLYLISGTSSILNQVQVLIPTADQLNDIIDQVNEVAAEVNEAVDEVKEFLPYTGPTPPVNPFGGQRWNNTTNGRSYSWILDVDSAQWVELADSVQTSNEALNLFNLAVKKSELPGAIFPLSLGTLTTPNRNFQLKSGSASDHSAVALSIGSISYDTSNKSMRAHDGVTLGGMLLAKESDITYPLANYTALRNFTKTNVSNIRITDSNLKGIFKLITGDTTTVDDGGVNIRDGVNRLWVRQFEGEVSILWFGVKSDNVDSSVNAQNWMNYTHDNFLAGLIPAGLLYKFSVDKPPSFYMPIIRGEGFKATRISSPDLRPVFNIFGGSGGPCSGYLADMGLVGFDSNVSTCLLIADQNDMPNRNLHFDNARYAIVLLNAGGFTEFVTFENCSFGISVQTDLAYRRTNGTDSFHGSGIKSCTSNENVGTVNAKIEIGGPLTINNVAFTTSNNILVYNAPLSGTWFKQTTAPFIYNTSTRPSLNMFGTVRFENFGLSAPFFFVLAGPPQNILFFGGDVQELNNHCQRGAMLPYQHLAGVPDGSLRVFLKPYTEPLKYIGGPSLVTRLYSTGGESYNVDVVMRVVGGQGVLGYSLRVHMEPGVAGQVTTTKTYDSFSGEFGTAPVFTMDSTGQLFVTPDPGTGANALSIRSTITQTGYPNGSAW